MKWQPIARDFYERNTVIVASELLGKILVRRIGDDFLSGQLVETEAYRGSDDPASHAFRGPTRRNRVMFSHGGFAYVYLSYGTNWCLNVTTEQAGTPGAVLIRAIEPLRGIDSMVRYRRLASSKRIEELTNGPGKLTQAMKITGMLNGIDLTRNGDLCLCEPETNIDFEVGVSPRVGIRRAHRRLWRFFIKDNKFVSRLESSNKF